MLPPLSDCYINIDFLQIHIRYTVYIYSCTWDPRRGCTLYTVHSIVQRTSGVHCTRLTPLGVNNYINLEVIYLTPGCGCVCVGVWVCGCVGVWVYVCVWVCVYVDKYKPSSNQIIKSSNHPSTYIHMYTIIHQPTHIYSITRYSYIYN